MEPWEKENMIREFLESQLYDWDDSIKSIIIEEPEENYYIASFTLWGIIRYLSLRINIDSLEVRWYEDCWETLDTRHFWMALLSDSEG